MVTGIDFEKPREYPFFTADRNLRRPDRIGGHIKEKTSSIFQRYVPGSEVGKNLQKIISEPLKSFKTPYAAIVSMPIKLETEVTGDMQGPIRSLVDAAAQVSDHVVFIPYLNSTVRSRRNQQDEIKALNRAANERAHDIADMIPSGSNLLLQTAAEHERPGTSWIQRRSAMFNIALSVLHRDVGYFDGIKGKWKAMHNTPYLQVDGDTRVGSDALKTIAQVLGNDDAIFVNGTLHYTGGVMEKSPAEVAAPSTSTNDKLLYFVEHLRRRMFDALSPISKRGYLSDFGLAVDFGVLATLGGYNELDEQNESYYLQWAAMDARAHQLGEIGEDEMHYPDAYIDPVIARRVNGLVYYAPRESDDGFSYPLDSSIRGIEANVSQFGRNALVNYDDGKDYITYTDFVLSDSPSKREPEPTLDELLALVNSVYSSFIDKGGKHPAEDHHESRGVMTLLANNTQVEQMNLQELLRVLFPTVQSERLVYWSPVYKSEIERA
jgi:hypothetical protein